MKSTAPPMSQVSPSEFGHELKSEATGSYPMIDISGLEMLSSNSTEVDEKINYTTTESICLNLSTQFNATGGVKFKVVSSAQNKFFTIVVTNVTAQFNLSVILDYLSKNGLLCAVIGRYHCLRGIDAGLCITIMKGSCSDYLDVVKSKYFQLPPREKLVKDGRLWVNSIKGMKSLRSVVSRDGANSFYSYFSLLIVRILNLLIPTEIKSKYPITQVETGFKFNGEMGVFSCSKLKYDTYNLVDLKQLIERWSAIGVTATKYWVFNTCVMRISLINRSIEFLFSHSLRVLDDDINNTILTGSKRSRDPEETPQLMDAPAHKKQKLSPHSQI